MYICLGFQTCHLVCYVVPCALCAAVRLAERFRFWAGPLAGDERSPFHPRITRVFGRCGTAAAARHCSSGCCNQVLPLPSSCVFLNDQRGAVLLCPPCVPGWRLQVLDDAEEGGGSDSDDDGPATVAGAAVAPPALAAPDQAAKATAGDGSEVRQRRRYKYWGTFYPMDRQQQFCYLQVACHVWTR